MGGCPWVLDKHMLIIEPIDPTKKHADGRRKVPVDVNQPLKICLNFQGARGRKQWLHVVYERLSTFCFLYGILGHGEAKCPTRYEENYVEP